MPISFTISIPSSERDDFVKELMDPNGNPSSRAKMIAREALAKARAERVIDDILDAEFMGTASERFSSVRRRPSAEVHSSFSRNTITADNIYSNYEITFQPSSSSTDTASTASTQSKMQEEQQRLTSTNSSKSRKKPNRSASTPSVADFANREGSMNSLFNERLDMLREFKKIHGHVNVPNTYKNSPLYSWIVKVRKAYREWKAGETLSYLMNDERVKQLEEIGFIWDPKTHCTNKSFEERLNKLREFKKIHGHVNVTVHLHPEHQSLAYWCKNVKNAYRARSKGRKKGPVLSDEKVKCLEELGFEWNLNRKRKKDSFQRKFKELLEFEEKYGTVEVPHGVYDHKSLALWCSHVRIDYRKWLNNKSHLPGKTGLTEEYIQILRDIGFRFDPLVSKKTFEQRIEELRQFKSKYGHANVTNRTIYGKEYESLAFWCSSIRSSYMLGKNNLPGKKSGLTEERVKILEEMGFSFKLKKRMNKDL